MAPIGGVLIGVIDFCEGLGGLRALGWRQRTVADAYPGLEIRRGGFDHGARLQAGFDTPITEKMRRFFYAADFGLIKTGSIRTPGRPLMLPVFEHVEAQIPQRIEAKIAEYLDKADRQFAAR